MTVGDTHMYGQGLPALQLINSCALVNVVVMMINSPEHNYDGQSTYISLGVEATKGNVYTSPSSSLAHHMNDSQCMHELL